MKLKLLLTIAFFIACMGLRAQFKDTVTTYNVRCFSNCSGSVEIKPSTGYHYKWSTGDSSTTGDKGSLCAGNYSCTVTDSLGIPLDTIQFIIEQPTELIIDSFSSQNASCLGDSDGTILAFVSGGTPPYTYNFAIDSHQFYSINGIMGNLQAGLYQVLVGDSLGCSQADTVRVGQNNAPCTGVNDIPQLQQLVILPNPAHEVMNLTYELDEQLLLNIGIYDLSGRKVQSVLTETETKGKQAHFINVKDLAVGNYVLNFTSAEGSFNARFVKE
ncbi:MAG: hypothetical protein JWO06_2685 [Bacteroidota bacterium]|nr:hypothetical protein [Bacteroidota bacterium]